MKIISDKDLIYDVADYDVILVGTSIYNMLTQGFQSKIAVMFPNLVDANNSTNYADKRKLGKRLTVDSITPIVSLMYICNYPSSKRVFLDYDALEHCMSTANKEFKGKKVATTILGTSAFDGNGDRERCMSIIERNSDEIDLTLYDFIQMKRREEIAMRLSKLNGLKESDPNKYYSILENKEELLKKMYLKH